MKNYIFIILFTLISSACKKSIVVKNQNDEKIKIIKTDINNKVENIKISIPKNVDSDFKIFLNFFNKDSIFQISRVEFPIKIKDFNEEFELRERTVNKDEYYLKKFDFNEINKTEIFNEYKQTITLNDNTALIEINGIENGIACEFYFKKINDIWKLVSWINQST